MTKSLEGPGRLDKIYETWLEKGSQDEVNLAQFDLSTLNDRSKFCLEMSGYLALMALDLSRSDPYLTYINLQRFAVEAAQKSENDRSVDEIFEKVYDRALKKNKQTKPASKPYVDSEGINVLDLTDYKNLLELEKLTDSLGASPDLPAVIKQEKLEPKISLLDIVKLGDKIGNKVLSQGAKEKYLSLLPWWNHETFTTKRGTYQKLTRSVYPDQSRGLARAQFGDRHLRVLNNAEIVIVTRELKGSDISAMARVELDILIITQEELSESA